MGNHKIFFFEERRNNHGVFKGFTQFSKRKEKVVASTSDISLTANRRTYSHWRGLFFSTIHIYPLLIWKNKITLRLSYQ